MARCRSFVAALRVDRDVPLATENLSLCSRRLLDPGRMTDRLLSSSCLFWDNLEPARSLPLLLGLEDMMESGGD